MRFQESSSRLKGFWVYLSYFSLIRSLKYAYKLHIPKRKIETIDKKNVIKTLKTTLTDSKEDNHIVQKKSEMIKVEK